MLLIHPLEFCWDNSKIINIIPYTISTKKLPHEKFNYTVTEKEFLVVTHAINKFVHYITSYQTFSHIDHSATIILMNKSINNVRITRWLMLPQAFDVTIVYSSRRDNVVDDFLSIFPNNGDDLPIKYFL